MKVYFRILGISVVTQAVGFLATYFLDFLLRTTEKSSVIPAVVGITFVAVSMLLSFVLAIKWCKSKRTTAITYILLPTNYTWVMLAIFVVRFVKTIIAILGSIPPDFG